MGFDWRIETVIYLGICELGRFSFQKLKVFTLILLLGRFVYFWQKNIFFTISNSVLVSTENNPNMFLLEQIGFWISFDSNRDHPWLSIAFEWCKIISVT